MIRKLASVLFLFLLLGLGQQSNSIEAQLNIASNEESSPKLDIITPEDLNWVAVSILQGNEYTLSDTTLGDTFSYSITDSLITIQEDLSDLCYAGVYAIVPVTNNKLAFSCEMRVNASHADARNGIIKLYDPINLRRLDATPIVSYRKDGSLDSGYNYFGIDYTIKNYEEVIIFIYYSDGWSNDFSQTVYVKDFQIHPDGNLPQTTKLVKVKDMDEFTWTAICTENWNFHTLPNPPLMDNGETDINFKVNETSLHFEELNSGTYDSFCGVYTQIDVFNEIASFSFIGKSKSNSVDITPNLKMAIYDPNSSHMILGIPDIGCWNENLTETEFNYFEFSLLVPGYTKVNLFFFYNDVSDLNDQHEFWISELKVSTNESGPSLTQVTSFPLTVLVSIAVLSTSTILLSKKRRK